MPEEKKKESFTFSDKIKSQGAIKSFASRIPSKIGSDGKPRQTLFERTKRDAPFLIAAAVALLLLPFLYKYSGHVDEDNVPMITPGYEDAIVNPDRSGFDFSGDPDGQISQLSGRDSMDLIVGFGKRRGEEEHEDSLADIYRSGLSDSSAKSSYRRSDMDEEENITNIYKHRKNAAPQTRAAFRRAATKIGNLKGGGINRSGGGLKGITPWGGGMKAAAQRVRGEGPRNSTKPVSLQPLQAAGKPSRSYFGQGAAKEAQRSKDAMSKGNAMQALMDAQMKPVEPGRIGGITGGDFGGPGGGNGNLHREFAFNGKEPWWWDLMKTREQMRWEKWFNYGWGWMDWATKLVQDIAGTVLKQKICCWWTGSDDCSIDTYYGGNADGSGGKKECCGLNEKDWRNALKGIIGDSDAFDKKTCKMHRGDVEQKAKVTCDSNYWKDTTGSSGLTRKQKQLECMGGLNARLTETSSCHNMKNYMYQVEKGGIAKSQGWNTYIYVVARNYVPEVSKELIKVSELQANGSLKATNGTYHYLCTEDTDSLEIGGGNTHGVSAVGQPQAFEDANQGRAKGQEKENNEQYEKTARSKGYHEKERLSDMRQLDPEDPQHGCVIYLHRGDTFNYKDFQTSIVKDYMNLLSKQGVPADALEAQARKAFNQLDLMFIEAVATKDTLGRGGYRVPLPIVYWRFYDAYVRHKGTTLNTIGGADNVDNRKEREEYVDYVKADKSCEFDDTVVIDCYDAEQMEYAMATVTFKQGYKGQNAPVADPDAVQVTATYTPLASKSTLGRISQPVKKAVKLDDYPNMLAYYFQTVLDRGETSAHLTELPKDESGTILWTVSRGGEQVGSAECNLNMDGDGVAARVETDPCAAKGINTSAECCAKYGGANHEWNGTECVMKQAEDPCAAKGINTSAECCAKYGGDAYEWKDGGCKLKQGQPDPCPNGKDTNAQCCTSLGGSAYEWIEGEGCKKKTNPNPITVTSVRLAPILTWIPSGLTQRQPVDAGKKPEQSHFTGSKLFTGTDREHCADGMGIEIINTPNATAFVKKVIAEYNRRNPDAPMADLAADYPTMGEFVDALNIASQYGIAKAPKDGVCLMARHVVRRSLDPHSKTERWEGNNVFFNELGAYLAYVHPDSAYYPDTYYENEDSQKTCDKRFLVLDVSDPASRSRCVRNSFWAADYDACGSDEACKAKYRKWHYTNYGYGGNLTPYTDSLKQLGIGVGYPLKALADGKTINPGTSCANQCRKQRDEYDRTFRYLLQGNCPTGDMNVTDALAYIKDGVCKNGLYTKPWGSGGNKKGATPVQGGPGTNGQNGRP